MTWNDRHDAWKDSYDAWKLASPPEYDGPDEECHHEDYEIGYDGRARCGDCHETWWPSETEIMDQRYRSAAYDKHCRREERKQWWRDQWYAWVKGPTFPLRFWLQGVVWRLFPKHRRINRFIDDRDEIPF